MSEMVERVARAILESVIAVFKEELPQEQRKPGSDMTLDDPRTREAFCRHARAALCALGEPTKEMIDRGGDVLNDCKDSDWDSGGDGEGHNSYEWIRSGSQTTIYQAMLDEALAEQSSTAK